MTPELRNRHIPDVDRRMALAGEWDGLVDEVRRLPGFEDFLQAPSAESLLSAAARGTVVVVNVSSLRCDALIVTAGRVRSIELPNLTAAEVVERTGEYLEVLRDGTAGSTDLSFAASLAARGRQRAERERVLGSTTEWLWDAVAEPVLDALGPLADTSASDLPPRLWWCPTGLLTLLPLHGAGHHRAGDGRTLLDRAVSSYTPTLRVLTRSLAPRSTRERDERLLFVGAPEVPDQIGLTDDVAVERDYLSSHIPGGVVTIEGPAATVEQVRQALSRHARVHISCHGRQNLATPSSAGFLLTDGTLDILRLSADRHDGDFAYLSACRTASGSTTLPDEVITLAAALNYSGYRHVIATLWSVDSAVAAEMTTAVYPSLVVGGAFRAERSAVALHTAIKDMRDAGRPLDDWLPFTHTGA
ncbi:hypothetical protein [Alloactinosynnema sp. L-07]|uniref:CHAT domain-containing protein n=1 Tax=Alloactinosynnema sp. L-07 TaxID=1653480 RepID=UPI00065F06B8|nr:CHAT domain-containing protein [Alloactinosynnema sp. L-07]CRK56831.1 hypothetical protein [Alloactinosynnema sp. L-07]